MLQPDNPLRDTELTGEFLPENILDLRDGELAGSADATIASNGDHAPALALRSSDTKFRVLRLVIKIGETGAPYNQFSLAVRKSHDITICTFFKPEIDVPEEIALFAGDNTFAGFFRALDRAILEKDYDVIHIHKPHVGLLLLLRLWKYRKQKRLPPILFTVHNSYQNFTMRNKLLLLPMFAFADKIVCCGLESMKSLPSLYRGLAGKRLCYISNGVDIHRVEEHIRRAAPRKHKNDLFTVLSIGRLIATKNPITLFNAFQRAALKEEAQLCFVGDGNLKTEIERQIRSSGLPGVFHLTGLIPRESVYDHCLSAHLFVSTSKGEGLPIAVLEAMACGLPVILSDIPPHREIARSESFIPLIHPEDVDGFAQEIRRFRQMPESERVEIGRRCRLWVQEHFSLQTMLSRYEDTYRELNEKNSAGRTGRIEGLGIAHHLFETFRRENIRYCQWKSNDRVVEGLAGITDLDILVDRKQYLQVQKALAACGFKRGTAGCGLTFPAKEGYIGFDKATGKLLYIDLHYRLVLGEERLKGYQFPWDDFLLRTRKWDPAARIHVADSNAELLLLLVRAALQISWRDVIRRFLGRKYFSDNWERQYHWLKARIDRTRCRDFCVQLLGEDACELFEAMVDKDVRLGQLLQFRRRIRSKLNLFRSYPPIVGGLLLLLRQFYAVLALVNRRYFGRFLPFVRKGPSSGGVFVVFIGLDGSGKSTIARELTSVLSWKFDVFNVYLGGNGSSSALRWPLVVVRKILLKLGFLKPSSNGKLAEFANQPAIERPFGLFGSVARALWALTLALEKRNKLKAIWRARNQGIIVISDRYPQTQIYGFNDGPLLADWLKSSNRFLRRFATWEMRPYLWANQNPADLVIQLMVPVETAMQRDPTLERHFLERRIAAVASMQFPPETSVIEVDANRPLQEVLRDVSDIVWQHV